MCNNKINQSITQSIETKTSQRFVEPAEIFSSKTFPVVTQVPFVQIRQKSKDTNEIWNRYTRIWYTLHFKVDLKDLRFENLKNVDSMANYSTCSYILGCCFYLLWKENNFNLFNFFGPHWLITQLQYLSGFNLFCVVKKNKKRNWMSCFEF